MTTLYSHLPTGRRLCDNTYMHRLNLTLPTPAENVALDEALLDWAEERAGSGGEVLRVWESDAPMIVAGRSTRIGQEIDIAECERRRIPIVRRSSGGATIVAGPGCLMYAVVLSLLERPELRDIGRAHTFMMSRLATAICELGLPVARAGTSDLVLQSAIRNPKSEIAKKFSGNSLRVKRNHILYHGTLLYDFDLALVAQCLKMPPRRPEYRGDRAHGEFVTNLGVERQRLVSAVDAAFPTEGALAAAPLDRVRDMVAKKFGRAEWTMDFA